MLIDTKNTFLAYLEKENRIYTEIFGVNCDEKSSLAAILDIWRPFWKFKNSIFFILHPKYILIVTENTFLSKKKCSTWHRNSYRWFTFLPRRPFCIVGGHLGFQPKYWRINLGPTLKWIAMVQTIILPSFMILAQNARNPYFLGLSSPASGHLFIFVKCLCCTSVRHISR